MKERDQGMQFDVEWWSGPEAFGQDTGVERMPPERPPRSPSEGCRSIPPGKSSVSSGVLVGHGQDQPRGARPGDLEAVPQAGPDRLPLQPEGRRRRAQREAPCFTHDSDDLSQAARKPKEQPKEAPKDHYTTGSYARAIACACDAAKVTHWHPNQLRHTAATYLRSLYGIETTRVILGHSAIATSEIYAEADLEKAQKAMRCGRSGDRGNRRKAPAASATPRRDSAHTRARSGPRTER